MEKPIIFSTPMVQAILAGRKTQTRRVIKPQPQNKPCRCGYTYGGWAVENRNGGCSCGDRCTPPCDSGDVLWVRESYCPRYFDDGSAAYKADYDENKIGDVVPMPKWKPSIHMPRAAARIFLRVTDVRAERLQEIKPQDAWAEGMEHIASFEQLWDSLNAKRGFGWAENPWVWVITFERAVTS